MPRVEMTKAASAHQKGANAGDRAVQRMQELEQKKFPKLGSIEDVRQEIDDALEQMREFWMHEPDEVMRLVSGHAARLVEIRVQIQRVEDAYPVWKRVRTKEVEPVLDELQSQFNIASRLVTVRQLDWEMSRGQGA